MYPVGKPHHFYENRYGLLENVVIFGWIPKFHRPPETISGWKTLPTGYCSSEIQLLLQFSCVVHRFYGFRREGIYS